MEGKNQANPTPGVSEAPLPELQQREQDFHLLSETIPQLIWITRPDGLPEYFNRRWHDYIFNNDDLTHYPEVYWAKAVHPADREQSRALWKYSLQTGEPFETESRLKNGCTGEYHWFLIRALPVYDGQGNVVKWFGTCTDIHEQKRAEERLRLLAGASTILAASLDFTTTLPRLAHLIGASFTDYCLISILDEDSGEYQRVAVAHDNPEMTRRALELERLYPPQQNSTRLRATFEARGGGSILVPEVSEEDLRRTAQDAAHLAALKAFGLKSVIMVPLLVRGILIGDLTLITADSGRIYSPADRDLAEEIARRIAVAIDNARLYREAQKALETQRELAYLKDLFLSVASHELRNPLTSIKGYTQLIQRSLLNLIQEDPQAAGRLERLLKPVGNLLSQANRMNDLINQLMDFSRIQNNQLDLRFSPHSDLVELAGRVVEQHHLAEPDRPLLVQAAEPTLPASFDPARLEQVLDNLINNAFKYSPPGTPVTVGLERAEIDGRAAVRVWVRDQGYGIEAEDRLHIFDRFYRVRSENTARTTGLGLGLYVSYEIIALHGGRMWLESAPGQGSTFYFAIPLEQAAS
jgi:PAS domain S-box-containing protein